MYLYFTCETVGNTFFWNLDYLSCLEKKNSILGQGTVHNKDVNNNGTIVVTYLCNISLFVPNIILN